MIAIPIEDSLVDHFQSHVGPVHHFLLEVVVNGDGTAGVGNHALVVSGVQTQCAYVHTVGEQ